MAPEDLRDAARRARDEARELRRLAGQLETSHVHQLGRLADDGTWVGPTASAFLAAARRGALALQAAADDLRRRAGELDLAADELDRAAARAELVRPG